MALVTSLECPICGDSIFEADENGLFYEDDTATCRTCGTICTVSVDESCEVEVNDEICGTASVSTNEDVEDIGQPRCDGSCGAVKEYVGTPCRWNCERALAWKKERG
jgi:hypothetical protein